LEECTRVLGRWIEKPKSAPPVVSSPLSAIDAHTVAGLRALRAGKNSDFYSQLVELFKRASTESLKDLRAAIDAGNLKIAASVCHKLLSSAANVGATEYAKQVRKLEHLCLAGDLPSAEDLHERLQAAHPSLLEALSGYCPRVTA
jgi:HPt (histidine-containing phosphotransfer) domain-containing protein